MEEPEVQHLLDACRNVQENSLYTAQAHFAMAAKASFHARLLLIIPSCCGAVAGMLVAFGVCPWVGSIAAASGLVTATASYLGVDQKAAAHKHAANLFTVLRHDARAMIETFWKDMSQEQLRTEIKRLHDRYNCYVLTLEMTDSKEFEKARASIKAGIHEMDFRQAGENQDT